MFEFISKGESMSPHAIDLLEATQDLEKEFENSQNKRKVRDAMIRNIARLLLEGVIPRDKNMAGAVMSTLFPHANRTHAEQKNPDLVAQGMEYLRLTRDISYPLDIDVSPWWRDKQKAFISFCELLTNPIDIVAFSQCTYFSGCDRRQYENPGWIGDVVISQLKNIEATYGICLPFNLPVEDSPYSIERSVIDVAGKQYSNSFLNMMGYYLGSVGSIANKPEKMRILELGAGYGSLARIIKLLHKKTQYTIIDIPETLLLSYVFLSLSFPDASIRFITSEQDLKSSQNSSIDFILVPAQLCESLSGQSYDLVINTGSLQEMPARAVEYYMKFIQEEIEIRYFYSFNYFLNARRLLKEWEETDFKREAENICPVIDNWWNTIRYKLNPLPLTVDCKGRNWLEVLLERVPHGQRDVNIRQAEAERLFTEADRHPVLSDPWLQNIWSAIWADRKAPYAQKMIDAIDLFTKNWRTDNHIFSGQYGSPSTPDATWEERIGFGEQIEELAFYRALLTSDSKAGIINIARAAP